MQQRKIKFLDTTLRDGEQTPGVNLNLQDKLRLARELDDMRIDVIEAGFAGSSEGDFEAVSAIAAEMKYSAVASLSRAVERDIIMSARAVEKAVHPVIHTFIATSEIHMKNKLRMTPEQVYDSALSAVRLAKKYTPVVEFSCEDATRSDREFLYKILEGVIAEGKIVQAKIVHVDIACQPRDAELAQKIHMPAHGNDVHDVPAGGQQIACPRRLFAVLRPSLKVERGRIADLQIARAEEPLMQGNDVGRGGHGRVDPLFHSF